MKVNTLMVSIILFSCGTNIQEDPITISAAKEGENEALQSEEIVPDAWTENGDISRNGDTLIFRHYYDTISVYGPAKYLAHVCNCENNFFFGESLLKPQSETIDEFLNRLRISREKYCDQAFERCSDISEYYRDEQNLLILKSYYLYQENTIDEALNILNENQTEWSWPSRHHDLLIGLLMQKYSRKEIEKELGLLQSPLERIISIKGIQFDWNIIYSYHYADYDENEWLKYFCNAMNQVEKFGI